MKSIFRPRSIGTLVLTLILAATVYGFANTNTVEATSAGDGEMAISGYNIIGVNYDIFGDGNPLDIDAISFNLQAPVATVWVSLETPTSWTDCTGSIVGNTVTNCPLNLLVTDADNLRIVAAD
ncbi:MAG: hypothetical protein MUP44_12835 [Anaerolineales bacterium]|nr:hypothetical protein [Anaerolineales bacterium]